MRKRLLQLVHIGKSQLGMDDETYRSLLSQQFYQNSAKNISYSELVKLVKILQQKGRKFAYRKVQPRFLLNNVSCGLYGKLWLMKTVRRR